jgi:RNA polymerase sigma-70 factor (ECF subfamily)
VSAPLEPALIDGADGEWPAGSAVRAVSSVDGDGPPRLDEIPDDGDTRSNEVFHLVYRQMQRLAWGRPDFDDLVQIAAEQVLRSLRSFEGRSKLSTWTYRICYVTVLRNERWYRRWLRRFSFTEQGELPERADSARDSVSFETLERAARLRKAVGKLSPKRRAVVILHDLEGETVEAVAGIVGAKLLTVRSRLRDGRRDLARLLAADPYFGDEACRPEETDR